MSSDDGYWVIVDVDVDCFYVLITEVNVICDGETCAVGDEVQIYYNNLPYTGKVVQRGRKFISFSS